MSARLYAGGQTNALTFNNVISLRRVGKELHNEDGCLFEVSQPSELYVLAYLVSRVVGVSVRIIVGRWDDKVALTLDLDEEAEVE